MTPAAEKKLCKGGKGDMEGGIVRRAKLGFASQGEIPTPEALARQRVPSVASQTVTSTAKRTQGGDGPQRASVKGLSPRYGREMWAPTSLARRKAISMEPLGYGSREPTGSRPGHVTMAESGTREILWVLPRMGVGWHNRHTGRKPDGPEEVGCPHRVRKG